MLETKRMLLGDDFEDEEKFNGGDFDEEGDAVSGGDEPEKSSEDEDFGDLEDEEDEY